MKKLLALISCLVIVATCFIMPTFAALPPNANDSQYMPAYDYIFGPEGTPEFFVDNTHITRWAFILNANQIVDGAGCKAVYVVPYTDAEQFAKFLQHLNTHGADKGENWVHDGFITTFWDAFITIQEGSNVPFVTYKPRLTDSETRQEYMLKWGCVPTIEISIEKSKWELSSHNVPIVKFGGWVASYGGNDWNLTNYVAPTDSPTGLQYFVEKGFTWSDNFIPPAEESSSYTGKQFDYRIIPRIHYNSYDEFGNLDLADKIPMGKYAAHITMGDTYSQGYQAAYNLFYTQRYNQGYNAGYSKGILDAEEYSVYNLIMTLFAAPSKLITGMLDFSLFGINVAMTVKALFTMLAIAFVVWMIIKVVKL